MIERTFKRNPAANALGLFTAAILISAVSVHPQNTTPGDASSGAGMQSGQSQSGSKNKSSDTKSSGAAGATSSESGSDKSAADAKAKGGLAASDIRLMRELAQANEAEIETGKLALSKTKSDQVRTFAQKMVDDHTKAEQQLQQLAQSKGVQLPTTPDAKHQAMMKKLSALSGDAFDKQYMKQAGVGDHRSAHRLVARIKNSAKDPDFKQLGATLLPDIDQHLQMAEQAVGGKSSSQSAGQTSSGK